VRRPRALTSTPAMASLSQSQARLRDDASVSRDRRFEARGRTSSASSSSRSSEEPASLRARRSNPASHILAGAIGGALSRTATAPIQTVRLRMVAGAMDGSVAANGGLAGEIARLARREGWRALFKGNLANVVRFAPTKGLDFFTFKVYKEAIGRRLGIREDDDDDDDASFETSKRTSASERETMKRRSRRKKLRCFQSVAAGALAGLTSTALLFPLDNLTTRLAVSGSRPRGSAQTESEVSARLMASAANRGGVGGLLAAARAVTRTEGARGLYRGLKPALLGIAPEAALTYGMFDLLKEMCAARTNRDATGSARAVGTWEICLCASAAALCGQTAAFPAEAVSRRLTSGAATGNALDVLRAIIKEKGVGGVYRGLGPASVRVVPMAAISFLAYERIRVAADEALERLGV